MILILTVTLPPRTCSSEQIEMLALVVIASVYKSLILPAIYSVAMELLEFQLTLVAVNDVFMYRGHFAFHKRSSPPVI